MKFSIVNADNYIAFAVLQQSLLVIMQQIMISVLQMPEESTTIYRVLLTAMPLSVAIMILFFKKVFLFTITYVFTVIILLFNVVLFPENSSFLRDDSLHFLLPVVIPSALCIMCVSSVKVVENVLYKISWCVVILMIFYIGGLLSGRFIFEGYNMTLSYGLLLPALSLYSRKHWYSICMALFLWCIIVAIGSRGAAIIFALYVCYDVFQYNKKLIFPFSIFVGICISFLPLFLEWLEKYGIHSRTLILLLTDDITSSSGRDYLYDKMLNVFWNNPIMGIGLWGDRTVLGGYCHNIILELYLNWGIIVASIILFVLIYILIKLYIKTNKEIKNMLVKYFLGTVVPLMASGSYLIDYNFGLFIGVLYLLSKECRIGTIKGL